MRYKNKRYLVGGLMIFFQAVFFKSYFLLIESAAEMNKGAFLIFIFLYMMEDIYSFKSYLIWDELTKQVKCWVSYTVLIIIIGVSAYNIEFILNYSFLGILATLYSFIMVKLLRKFLSKKIQTNLVIIGTGKTAKELQEIIRKNSFI